MAVKLLHRESISNGWVFEPRLVQLESALAAHAAQALISMPDMLTTAEVAFALGYSPARIRQIADRLGGQKTYGRWYFPRQQVEYYRERSPYMPRSRIQ
jgi:hypothetical protein